MRLNREQFELCLEGLAKLRSDGYLSRGTEAKEAKFKNACETAWIFCKATQKKPKQTARGAAPSENQISTKNINTDAFTRQQHSRMDEELKALIRELQKADDETLRPFLSNIHGTRPNTRSIFPNSTQEMQRPPKYEEINGDIWMNGQKLAEKGGWKWGFDNHGNEVPVRKEDEASLVSSVTGNYGSSGGLLTAPNLMHNDPLGSTQQAAKLLRPRTVKTDLRPNTGYRPGTSDGSFHQSLSAISLSPFSRSGKLANTKKKFTPHRLSQPAHELSKGVLHDDSLRANEVLHEIEQIRLCNEHTASQLQDIMDRFTAGEKYGDGKVYNGITLKLQDNDLPIYIDKSPNYLNDVLSDCRDRLGRALMLNMNIAKIGILAEDLREEISTLQNSHDDLNSIYDQVYKLLPNAYETLDANKRYHERVGGQNISAEEVKGIINHLHFYQLAVINSALPEDLRLKENLTAERVYEKVAALSALLVKAFGLLDTIATSVGLEREHYNKGGDLVANDAEYDAIENDEDLLARISQAIQGLASDRNNTSQLLDEIASPLGLQRVERNQDGGGVALNDEELKDRIIAKQRELLEELENLKRANALLAQTSDLASQSASLIEQNSSLTREIDRLQRENERLQEESRNTLIQVANRLGMNRYDPTNNHDANNEVTLEEVLTEIDNLKANPRVTQAELDGLYDAILGVAPRNGAPASTAQITALIQAQQNALTSAQEEINRLKEQLTNQQQQILTNLANALGVNDFDVSRSTTDLTYNPNKDVTQEQIVQWVGEHKTTVLSQPIQTGSSRLDAAALEDTTELQTLRQRVAKLEQENLQLKENQNPPLFPPSSPISAPIDANAVLAELLAKISITPGSQDQINELSRQIAALTLLVTEQSKQSAAQKLALEKQIELLTEQNSQQALAHQKAINDLKSDLAKERQRAIEAEKLRDQKETARIAAETKAREAEKAKEAAEKARKEAEERARQAEIANSYQTFLHSYDKTREENPGTSDIKLISAKAFRKLDPEVQKALEELLKSPRR